MVHGHLQRCRHGVAGDSAHTKKRTSTTCPKTTPQAPREQTVHEKQTHSARAHAWPGLTSKCSIEEKKTETRQVQQHRGQSQKHVQRRKNSLSSMPIAHGSVDHSRRPPLRSSYQLRRLDHKTSSFPWQIGRLQARPHTAATATMSTRIFSSQRQHNKGADARHHLVASSLSLPSLVAKAEMKSCVGQGGAGKWPWYGGGLLRFSVLRAGYGFTRGARWR